MMIHRFLFIFVFLVLPLSAQYTIRPATTEIPDPVTPTTYVEDELTMLNNIIAATEVNLRQQKALHAKVIEYRQLHDQYVQNIQDKELSFQLIFSSHELLDEIKELQLTQAFDQKFLSDLAFFSNIAERHRETP